MQCGRWQPVKHDTIGLHWGGGGEGVLGRHMGSKRTHTHIDMAYNFLVFSYSPSKLHENFCTIGNRKLENFFLYLFWLHSVDCGSARATHTQAHTRIHRHTRPTHGYSQRLLTYKQIHILATLAAISKVLYALL